MAGRGLGTLTLDLIAKIGGFTGPLSKAERDLDRSTKRMNKMAYNFGRAIGTSLKVATGLLVSFAGVAAYNIGKTIDNMDDMSKAAQRVGASTEEFSRLVYSGQLADVEMSTLVSTFGKLTKAQSAALDETTDQAKVFKALGIEIKDADGKLRSSTVILSEFADKFKALEGSPEAMAAGFALFGRSFQDLIPLIKGGSEGLRAAADESDRLGATLSGPAGDAAEKFNDDITRLKTIIGGVWKEIAIGLLPNLDDAALKLQDMAMQGDLARNATTLLSTAINAGVGLLDSYNNAVARVSITMGIFASVAEGALEVNKNLATLGFADGGIAGGIRKQIDAFKNGQKELDSLIERQEKNPVEFSVVFAGDGDDPAGLFKMSAGETAARKEAEKLRAQIQAALGKNVSSKGGGKTGKSESEKEAERLLAAYERLKSSLTEQAALFGQVGATAKERYDLENGELAKLAPAQKQELLTLLDKIDALHAEKDVQEELDKISRAREDAINRDIQNAAQMIDSMQFELSLITMTNEQREREIALRQAGAGATEAQKTAILDLTDAMIKQQRETSDQIELMDGLRDSAKGFLSDLYDGVGIWDALSNALDNFADKLFDMASSKVIEQLFGQMGSSAGGSAGGGWGALLGALFGGGKASGGWAMPNKIYEVNERGMEMATVGGRDYMLTGNQPVNVTPADRVGGSRSLHVTNNFLAQNLGSHQTQKQQAQRAGMSVQVAMASNR